MDRTVPLAAARLLDFIRETEVGNDGPAGYGVIYGHNQTKLPEPLTRMTIDEIIGAGAGWTKRFGSSAAGGYQFMRATLTDLKRELGLRGTQILDPDLQDRLAFHLLKRRGYEAFMAGEIGRADFGKRLAQEWASFPVLVETKGAKRQVVRGQSFYAGDGLNKALVKPEEVEGILDELLAIGDAMPAPVPIPEPRPESSAGTVVVIEPEAAPSRGSPAPTGGPTSKATGGALGAGLPNVLLLLAVKLRIIPAEVATDPETLLYLTAVLTIAGGWLGSYLAPPNARVRP